MEITFIFEVMDEVGEKIKDAVRSTHGLWVWSTKSKRKAKKFSNFLHESNIVHVVHFT